MRTLTLGFRSILDTCQPLEFREVIESPWALLTYLQCLLSGPRFSGHLLTEDMVLWRVWHGYPDKKVWTGNTLHPGFSGLGLQWRFHSMTCLVPIILAKVAVVSIGTAGISLQGLFHFSVLRNWNLAQCLLAAVCLYFVIQMQINKSLSVSNKNVALRSQPPWMSEKRAAFEFPGPLSHALSTVSSSSSSTFFWFLVRPLENNFHTWVHPLLFCPRPIFFNLITSCLTDRK